MGQKNNNSNPHRAKIMQLSIHLRTISASHLSYFASQTNMYNWLAPSSSLQKSFLKVFFLKNPVIRVTEGRLEPKIFQKSIGLQKIFPCD